MGNKVVGIIVTIAFFVLVALVGYRLYHEQSTTQDASAPPAIEEGEQAAAPEPEDKAGEETEAAQDGSATSEDEAADASKSAESGADRAAGEEPLAEDGEGMAGEGQAEAGGSADIPSFDVVRIEQTGEGVIAGRAEPGWGIEIQSNGTGIAQTKADPAGQWSLVLDEPLGDGEHSLTILATSPDGGRSLTSQQTVLVSMGDEESDKTVVALREPGKATQILQEHSARDESAEAKTGSDAKEKATSEQRMAAADTDTPAGAEKDQERAPSGDDMSAAGETGDASDEDRQPDRGGIAAGEEEPSAADRASQDETAADDSASEETVADDTVEAKEAGEETSEPEEPPLRIKTVDYEDRGSQSGQIIVTGTSTSPSTEILLYLDGELIGEGRTGSDGAWKIEATKYLEPGNRALQVDLVDRSKDMILGRAAVGMRRQEPPPTAKEVAKAEPEASGQTGEADSGGASSAEKRSEGEVASSESDRSAETDRVAGDKSTSGASDMSAPDSAPSTEEQSTASASDVQEPDRAPGEEIPDPDRAPGDMASAKGEQMPESGGADHPKVYTVRRGDTLWAIAEEYFGGGWRYTMIFKDNRNKIRNPHWIYPDQEFEIRPR